MTEDFDFGTFHLSRRNRALTKAGLAVPLGTRAFDLLLVLIERAGTVVSKRSLLDLVWPGLAVEEGNLHVQIVALRKALGADPQYIRNIPGRGYCFTADLQMRPGLTSLPAPAAGELPIPAGAPIGRDAERAELTALLAAHRLLTITGPSGIGKTQLALALAADEAAHFPGGARLIDLAPLPDARSDTSLIESQTLAALGLRGADGNAMDAIAASLNSRPALLVFDNCEHLLLGAAAFARNLLQRCSFVRILATSQERLRIPGEQAFRLDPLALPPVGLNAPDALLQYGAVALFVLRLQEADRRFVFGPGNAAIVSNICRSLDGIPLALEMAAARAPALGLEILSRRLNERLAVLTAGDRTAAKRHQTLRDTVAFSTELLDPPDRAVFRQLGIFAGGFSAAAAAGVLAPDEDEWPVIDALSRLVDKSLVVASADDTPRYHLLETLKLFALEQMAAHAEHDALALRHARYFERVLNDAYQSWETTDDRAWLARMEPERANIRAAVEMALTTPGLETLAISLTGAAALLWDRLSLLNEGRRYLDRAAALLTPATPTAVAARLYRQIGNLWHASDRKRALAALDQAETLYRALDDRASLGAVLTLQGLLCHFGADPAKAEAALQEARLCLQNSTNRRSVFNMINSLGVVSATQGDLPAARLYFEQALQTARALGAPDREAVVLINLAEVACLSGDLAAAVSCAADAAAILRATKQDADLGWLLVNMTAYLLISEQPEEAEHAAREALLLVRGLGGHVLRTCLQQLALLAAVHARYEDAARLLGFVDAGFAATGAPREYTEQCVRDQLQAKLASHLPPVRQDILTAEGARWSEATATACADDFLAALKR